jgi:hypothetical protein
VGRTGRCLCGAVTYEIEGDVIATAVSHCEHCQPQSGSAFSVSVMVHESQLSLTGEPSPHEETGERGDAVYVRRRFCGACGSSVVSELVQADGMVAVKADTLDDTADVQPLAEVWCVDRQPSVELPGIAISLDRES